LLEGTGWHGEILTACSDDEFAGFDLGDSRADQRFFHACIRNQRVNMRRAATADVIFMHRGLFPFGPWQRPTFERQLARLNDHIVYDFFDAIWLPRQTANRQVSRTARWLHPADKIEEIIRLARVVTVSNERLAEWARPQHPDVRVLPMLIDVDDYELRHHGDHSPVVLGWVGNRHQLPRLASLAPALRDLSAKRDVLLRVVSSEPVEIAGVPVECHSHPWSPSTDRADFSGIDIGLLPLEDTPYARGKSPFKLLQYAAAGLPVVATPVAIDLSIMEPGRTFLPARNEHDWLEALLRLVDDVKLRHDLGMAAREAVQRHYSYVAYAQEFLNILQTASGPR
jgi:glycosyltransferase involved in cell wall biosynthesis